MDALKAALGDSAAAVDRAAADRAVAQLAAMSADAHGLDGDTLRGVIGLLVMRYHHHHHHPDHHQDAADESNGGDLRVPKGFAAWRDGMLRRVLRSLIPRDSVPAECVLAIVGCLNSLEHSVMAKTMLLKWLLLVWDVLEDTAVQQLRHTYGVVFHYLEYESMRPALCQVLVRLTTHDHVKLFRCNKLMDLFRRVGKEPALLSLMTVYKTLQPQWINVPNLTAQPAKKKGHANAAVVARSRMILTKIAPTDPTRTPAYLAYILKMWDGVDNADQVFRLVSKLAPQSYDVLYVQFFAPLQRLYLTASLTWKYRLLSTYTKLLGHWATIDWHAHFNREHTAASGTGSEQLATDIDHFRTMREFVSHVDRLAVAGLLLEHGHALVEHATLGFFEQAAAMNRQHHIPFVAIPSRLIVLHCLVSPTAMTVSRLCGLIAQYKQSYDWLKVTSSNTDHVIFDGYCVSEADSFPNGVQNIKEFNVFIRDSSSVLWRMKLPDDKDDMSDEEKTFLFKDLPPQGLHKYTERPTALSLMHSSAFVGFTRRFMNMLGGEALVQQVHEMPELLQSGSFKPRQMGLSITTYSDLRIKLLAFLKQQHVDGVNQFLYTFIQSLVKQVQA